MRTSRLGDCAGDSLGQVAQETFLQHLAAQPGLAENQPQHTPATNDNQDTTSDRHRRLRPLITTQPPPQPRQAPAHDPTTTTEKQWADAKVRRLHWTRGWR